MNGVRIVSLGIVALCMGFTLVAQDDPLPLARVVAERLRTIEDDLETDGDLAKARKAIDDLFDRVIAVTPIERSDPIRDVALARRRIRLVASAASDERRSLFAFLRRSRNLSAALCFGLGPGDSRRGALAVLETLRDEHGARLERYANLTAAICIVRDKGKPRRDAATVLELFKHYAGREKRMFFGVRNLPVELLVHVVDVSVSPREMRWALARYGGDSNVGERYNDVPYDDAHFYQGAPKKIEAHGYTLQNLRKYGGICGDQGFFASQVGKSIGVPAVASSGRAGQVGHCWVGYFEGRGRTVGWNFLVGRFEEYRNVRGWVRDYNGRMVPEGRIAVLDALVGTTPARRETAHALVDAAERIRAIRRGKRQLRGTLGAAGEREAPRAPTVEAELEFVERAVNRSVACLRGWEHVATLARSRAIDEKTIADWAKALGRACGRDYADFSAAILVDLIRGVPDTARQATLWRRARRYFRRRPDVAAELAMHEARLWEGAKEPAKAHAIYKAIIENHANDGGFVLDALARARALLEKNDRRDVVPKLYAKAWSKARQPEPSAVRKASNWYRIASAYAAVCDDYGMKKTAKKIRRKITSVMG